MSHDLAPVLGAIHYERDFAINSILRTVVKSLQVKGVKVGGVLQESELRPNGCCAQLNIVDIRTGKTERITQDRGRESRGCKLDPRGLAAISHCITDAIDADVGLVIINKFGRAESEGGACCRALRMHSRPECRFSRLYENHMLPPGICITEGWRSNFNQKSMQFFIGMMLPSRREA